MQPDDFSALLTPAGQRLLAAAMAEYGGADPLALAERLRLLDGGHPAGVVAAALTQARLRERAAGKFGAAAAGMYFTATGLEQATAPRIARHRARRLAAQHSSAQHSSAQHSSAQHSSAHHSPERLFDLGCGIGSDLLAFAAVGCAVHGVDSDPLTARVAAANLDAFGLEGAVREGLAEDVRPATGDSVFLDPARRTARGRTFDPAAFSPPWQVVLDLLTRAAPAGGGRPTTAVKLAPGLDHGLIPDGIDAEWTSLDGDLKEVCLWAPAADPPGHRRATVLSTHTDQAFSVVGPPDEPAAMAGTPVGDVGRFVYEPDPALIRAHLVSTVVEATSGWLIDPHVAYVSADRLVESPLARCFRVVEVLPYQEKQLRAALRARGVGPLTIKKRGVEVRPEDLRRRLVLRGDVPATLILSRTPRSAIAILAEPVRHDDRVGSV